MTAILSLGSINADFELRVERPPEGPGTLLAHDLLRTSGGKAANVAVLARRLGAEARLLGCVGDDDLAEQALTGPTREGVDVTLVRRASGPTGVACIVVMPGGDKTIVLALNANEAWSQDADRLGQEVAEAPAGSVLVADLELPPVLVTAAARAARRAGLAVVLDPAPAERLPDDLLALVDHITPDHREAQALTGIDASSAAGACRAAEALHQRGVGAAYVKLASGGCAVACQDGTGLIQAPADVVVVDATGAGDAFAGALACALVRGHRPGEAASLPSRPPHAPSARTARRSPIPHPRGSLTPGAGGDAPAGGKRQPVERSGDRRQQLTGHDGAHPLLGAHATGRIVAVVDTLADLWVRRGVI